MCIYTFIEQCILNQLCALQSINYHGSVLALASLHYSSAQLFSCCSTTIAFVDISETSIRIRLLCPHYIRGMRLSPKDYLLSRLVCCFTKVTMVYQGCLWPHTTITMPLYLLHTYVYTYMPRSSDRTHPLWLWTELQNDHNIPLHCRFAT